MEKFQNVVDYLSDKDSSSQKSSDQPRKRGRPRKKIDLDTDGLWDKLSKEISNKVKKICTEWEYDLRADTLRVWLIRLAKKIPLLLLSHLHSKSIYKAVDMDTFKRAYLNTYKRFHILLRKKAKVKKYEKCLLEMEDHNNPPYFLEFCSLHFPQNKVLTIC